MHRRTTSCSHGTIKARLQADNERVRLSGLRFGEASFVCRCDPSLLSSVEAGEIVKETVCGFNRMIGLRMVPTGRQVRYE